MAAEGASRDRRIATAGRAGHPRTGPSRTGRPRTGRPRTDPSWRALAAGVLAVAVLAGCGSASGTAGPADRAASPAVEVSGPADREIGVTVRGGRVVPPPGRVEVGRGQVVRIVVISDVPDTIHVHGYELGVDLSPNVPGSVQFVADRDGLFDVETHAAHLLLFQLVVR